MRHACVALAATQGREGGLVDGLGLVGAILVIIGVVLALSRRV